MQIRIVKSRPIDLKGELIWAVVTTVVLVGALVLPLLPVYHYPCMFLKLTGKPCLSCGMTRSLVCAVRGEFLTAWRWNPLGLVLFFVMVVYAPYAWAVLLFGFPCVHVRLTRRWERIVIVVLILAALAVNWFLVWHSGMPY